MSESDGPVYTITTRDSRGAKMMIDVDNLLGVIRTMDEHLRATMKYSDDEIKNGYYKTLRDMLWQLIEEYGVQEYLN